MLDEIYLIVVDCKFACQYSLKPILKFDNHLYTKEDIYIKKSLTIYALEECTTCYSFSNNSHVILPKY